MNWLLPSFDKLAKLLLLVSLFVLLIGCAHSWTATSNQMAAYAATLANNPEEARSLLKLEPENSFNKFMLSSIELSEGNLALAKEYANEFMQNTPYSPEGKVLLELIEQRKVSPEESWTVSFASAWKASGSPRLKVIYRFLDVADPMDIESISDISDSCKRKKTPASIVGTPDELLAAYMSCDKERLIELSLTYSSSEAPLYIKLLAFDVLNSRLSKGGCESTDISEDLRNRGLVRKKELIKELSAQLPTDMVFPLISILDRTSEKETFSEEDIKQIESAVSRPRLSPLPGELYNEYLKRVVVLEEPNPYLVASTLAFSVTHIFSLGHKIFLTAETTSLETKKRLAAILEKFGKAQLRERTLIGLLLCISDRQVEANLRDDIVLGERLRNMRAVAKRLVDPNIFDIAFSARALPIRALVIDSNELNSRDEVGFFQLFSSVDLPDDFLTFLKD